MTVSRINNQTYTSAGNGGVKPAAEMAEQFLTALTSASTARTQANLTSNAQANLVGRGRTSLADIPTSIDSSADDAGDDVVVENDEVDETDDPAAAAEGYGEDDYDEYDTYDEYDGYDAADAYWDPAEPMPPSDGEVVTVRAAEGDDDGLAVDEDLDLDDDALSDDDQEDLLAPDALVAMVDPGMTLPADTGMTVPTSADGPAIAGPIAAGAGGPQGAADPLSVPQLPDEASPDLADGDADAPSPLPQAQVLQAASNTAQGQSAAQAAQAAALAAVAGPEANISVQVEGDAALPTSPTVAAAVAAQTVDGALAPDATTPDGALPQAGDEPAQDGTDQGQAEGMSHVRVQAQQAQDAQARQQGSDHSDSQGGANAASAQAATQQGAASQSQPARTFAATLMAAQSEASGGGAAPATVSGTTSAAPMAGLGTGGQTLGSGATLAGAQSSAAARPQTLPTAQEVVDQIKVQIARQGASGDTIKVQLRPVELGAIEVKLSVAKDGSVSGVVTADNKDTLALLKSDSSSLEKALSDAGFKTDQGSLEFSLRGDNSQNQSAQNDTGWRRSRRSRSFDSATLEAAQGIDAASPTTGAGASALSGVDIQV